MTRNPQFAPTQRQAYDGKGQTLREAVMFPKQGFPVFLFTFLASLSTQAFAGVETEWFGFGEPPTPSPELFAGISAPESSSDSSALPASIEWSVEVNRDLLATQPETIVLNLPDREAVTIARDRSLVRSPGAFLWSGSGNGCSLIVNTLPDEVIATIGCSSGTYRVRTSESGAHLTRIAYADAPPGAENDVAIATSDVPDGSSAGSLSAITPLLPAIDDHIDVLILYTTTLRQSIENTGGNVQLAMQQLMDETQQAMIDSASAQTSFPLTNVSLVRAQEIVRDETT